MQNETRSPQRGKAEPAIEMVVHQLELDVVLGRLRPRERVIEDELIARFDAKRHVIRSALAELERMGLLERRPNRGAVVREYGVDEVNEIYDFRAALHRLAVARMALPLPAPAIAELRALCAAHREAIAANDVSEVILRNNRFHDRFFEQCGNRYIAESIQLHAWRSNAIRSYRIADPVLLAQAAAEHTRIVDLAEEGQREALADLCVRHIEPSKLKYLADRMQMALG